MSRQENAMPTRISAGVGERMMLMVLGRNIKQAVGTGSVIMTLVALTGAASHLVMGATVVLLPAFVITLACTVCAVGSARFANRVDEKLMRRCAGVVLSAICTISLFWG